MWVHTLDPTIVELFGFEVRYYGLVYVFGFLLAMYFLFRSREELGLTKDDVYDFVFYLMLGVLIGSRLFHVLFWEPAYYFANPLNILYLWEGGMAFHGGLVGIVVAGLFYCKKKSVSFFKVADVLTVPALVALAFGRVANFVNAELVGPVTGVSWCVDFGDGLCRHPYQLYSAVKRFFVAGLLFSLRKQFQFKDGFIFWLMVLLMGIGRFFLDFYREDVLYFMLSMGQWMSLLMVLVALPVLLFGYSEDLRKIFK